MGVTMNNNRDAGKNREKPDIFCSFTKTNIVADIN